MQKLVAVNERGMRIGEDHPNARYTDAEIDTLWSLRDEGYGYKRIALFMDMPVRTVRDIIKGKRRAYVATRWKRVRVADEE